jgi:NCS2 family nucleobase:cation symporter-2
MLGGSAGVNFGDELYQYLVSTSLIVSGVLSAVQMFRLHIRGTKYYIGTGLLSVVGRYTKSTPQIRNQTLTWLI